jgi:tetratricopeptide (TPR) repeat protein
VAALGSYRQALPIYLAQSAGKPTYAVAFTRANLGNVLANAHRYEEALREWREADAIYSALYGPEDERARLARSGTALTLTKLGRLDEADALFAALLKRPFHSRIEEVAIEGRLGTLRSAQGRHEEAHALVRDAPAFFADSPPERQRALALAELGHVLLAGGRHAEALEPLQQARTLLLKSQRNGSPDLADISVDIARAQISLARPDMAVAAADDAVAFWSRFDPNHRDTGVALLWQARALAASGQQENAADAVGRAGSILASSSLPADRALLQQTRRDMRIQ